MLTLPQRVLPVLAKLNTETMKGTRVKAMQKPSHHKLSAQIKPLDLVDDFRLEILFDRHGRRRKFSVYRVQFRDHGDPNMEPVPCKLYPFNFYSF